MRKTLAYVLAIALTVEVGILRKTLAYVLAIALTVVTVSYTVLAQQRSRLDTVRARGKLICGVSGATPGFSFPDPTSGRMTGFDAEFCNAVAAFLDVPEVEFVNLTSASRIPAVVAGSVDVVFRTTTVTITRDDQVDFGPVTFFDGQRLLVRTGSRIRDLGDLNGARVCAHAGTTSERNITDQLRARGIRFQLITFAEAKQAFDGLAAGRCDVFTTDASQLASFRATAPNPADFALVGKPFSDEPLAPLYQENDSKWADVVNWTVWSMI
ncbi:MAG: transporter substrate-binding domain-containing protein, partial [Armatimonadetes bacterium]|nr:transporter substrate-binding domain-containing protein [Armatimonadota bacterium]